jgi:cytochrome b561
LGHLALYAIMVLTPLVGWAALSAFGKPIPFFGFELPALLAPDKELGRSIMEVHELGGNLAYFLIGGHAVAALYHHYFMKDNTLLRMTLR